MQPTMHRTTPDELQRRRDELIQKSGMTESELRQGAMDYMLSPDEVLLWDELRRIDFLLGE